MRTKNIYDIFEQRKIDLINCEYVNIMESFNELDHLYNTLENDCFEYVDEAFDFKEMKSKIKKGAKTVGNTISTAIQNLIHFIKELWKKIKGFFKQVKERLIGKKDTKKIIEEKLKEVVADNEDKTIDKSVDDNNDDGKVDFGEWVDKLGEELKELRKEEREAEGKEKESIQKEIAVKKNKIIEVKAKMTKKKVSDAERKYRDEQSQKRLKQNKNYNQIPTLEEILTFSQDRTIKAVPFASELTIRLNKVLGTIEDFISAFRTYGSLQENAYESGTIYGYLRDEIKGIDDDSVDGMKKYILGHDNVPREMKIKDIKKGVIYILEKRARVLEILNGLDKQIDKSYSETLQYLEGRHNMLVAANKTQERGDKNKGRKNSEINMESIQCLRSSSQALLQISQIIIQTCESEYNRASAIATNATDYFIKERMK